MGGLFGKKPEEDMTFRERLKAFLAVHWRGVVCVLTPTILLILLFPFPPKSYQWCGYTLLLMAVFWVTECIPLAVTSFLPVVIFPMTGVMSTTATCKAYMNDTILMFVGSLILAYSVEQSGLHKRFAYAAIRLIGYSHVKLLFAMCTVTMFVSMWVTNTAATTMMVPILFALLKVFDDHGICSMWETTKEGDKIASDISTCYFCAITFSATIGGIGTLVGTATNLAFKGLFQSTYPLAPEYLSFLKFSAFAIPYMLVMEFFVFVYLAILYFGAGRPRSEAAKSAQMTDKGILAAKKAIQEDTVKMGRFTFWEGIVLVLFSLAMIGFFSRSPQLFPGWGDRIHAYFYILDSKYIRDSALAMLICFLMFLLPSTLAIFNNCKAKFMHELPKGRIPSVLDWARLNAAMPFSFMFLLGGGFALSEAAKNTGLNDKIGESLKFLKDLPNVLIILFIIILVVFITNFASNVAVANVMAPLAMQMAKEIHRNPLWYCIAAGFSASYCFMIPVGTPGNLIVQSAANIPTRKMIIAGLGPTITTIIITWLAMSFWAPIIWPLHLMPIWTGVVLAPAPGPEAPAPVQTPDKPAEDTGRVI